MSHSHGQHHPPTVNGEHAWDERYSADEQMWSGNVNQALVAEVASMTPGRALDVGCGEGADAVWLARHGWQVTAIDVSGEALNRACRLGEASGLEIDWQRSALEDFSAGGFDLVSMFYPALVKAGGAIHALLAQVAPGGTLLVVHHAHLDRERALSHGFDPDQLVSHDDLVAALAADSNWHITLDETRERTAPTGAGAHHTTDVVLRAERR